VRGRCSGRTRFKNRDSSRCHVAQDFPQVHGETVRNVFVVLQDEDY